MGIKVLSVIYGSENFCCIFRHTLTVTIFLSYFKKSPSLPSHFFYLTDFTGGASSGICWSFQCCFAFSTITFALIFFLLPSVGVFSGSAFGFLSSALDPFVSSLYVFWYINLRLRLCLAANLAAPHSQEWQEHRCFKVINALIVCYDFLQNSCNSEVRYWIPEDLCCWFPIWLVSNLTVDSLTGGFWNTRSLSPSRHPGLEQGHSMLTGIHDSEYLQRWAGGGSPPSEPTTNTTVYILKQCLLFSNRCDPWDQANKTLMGRLVYWVELLVAGKWGHPECLEAAGSPLASCSPQFAQHLLDGEKACRQTSPAPARITTHCRSEGTVLVRFHCNESDLRTLHVCK